MMSRRRRAGFQPATARPCAFADDASGWDFMESCRGGLARSRQCGLAMARSARVRRGGWGSGWGWGPDRTPSCALPPQRGCWLAPARTSARLGRRAFRLSCASAGLHGAPKRPSDRDPTLLLACRWSLVVTRLRCQSRMWCGRVAAKKNIASFLCSTCHAIRGPWSTLQGCPATSVGHVHFSSPFTCGRMQNG